jgi:hypothetical protein
MNEQTNLIKMINIDLSITNQEKEALEKLINSDVIETVFESCKKANPQKNDKEIYTEIFLNYLHNYMHYQI